MEKGKHCCHVLIDRTRATEVKLDVLGSVEGKGEGFAGSAISTANWPAATWSTFNNVRDGHWH